MRSLLVIATISALGIPAIASAAPRPATDSGVASRAVANEDFQLAARAVRRGVVVGPRGRVHTFAYRGRRINRIRRPRFVYPHGYAYRRWRAGELLPPVFVGAPYFFGEYKALGLAEPKPGYRWVRFGPDVVLVEVKTRKIVDVVHGAIDDED